MSPSVAPVYGLVLAGGSSSRMHSDKATLVYQGQTQLDRVFTMLGRHAEPVFVAVRSVQSSDPTRARRPLIVDSETLAAENGASPGGRGPMLGIRSALAAYPEAAWLVVACDLPFLTDAVLAQLLTSRDPSRLATAFRSAHDGLPEPLCAIWEPAAAAALTAHQLAGRNCPRKFLINHPVKLVELVDRRALDNINTPEEYAGARLALGAGDPGTEPKPMQLKIQYFALLREQSGRSHETLDTQAATPAELYAELQARYPFTLPREQLKVAVNSDFSDWSRPLAAGDSVVFIPPVAGG